MKKTTTLLLVCMLAIFSAGMVFAKPIYLVGKASVDASDPMDVNGTKIVRYTFRYTDAKDMWHDEQVMFCADAKRDGCDFNVPIGSVKTEGLVRTWDIPLELIQWNQSGTNWAKSEDLLNTSWLGIPDCRNLTVGKNLIIARSLKDANIEGSGGHYLLYVGPGAPYIPTADEVLSDEKTKVIYTCGAKPVATPVSAPVAKGPCIIVLKGDKERTEILKGIIEKSNPGVKVETVPGTGKIVTVSSPGATEHVTISDKLLAELRKVKDNPDIGLDSVCITQAGQIRKVISMCN